MKKIKCILAISTLFILVSSLSAEIYQVIRKDSLIKIIRNKYPEFKIYGSSGMLKKILALNPKIQNADLIYVNQRIQLFPEKTKDENPLLTEQPPVPETRLTSTRVISNDRLQSDSWTLKVLYGLKYLSHDQSKTLTGLNLTTLSSDLLKVESEFKYDDYKFTGTFETHSFSFASSNYSRQKRLSSYELTGVWNNYLVGLSFKETPLIKATTTSLDIIKESQIGLMIGYDKTWALPTTKPTSIGLRSSVTIPFKNNSEKSDVTLSSLSGFELKTNLELSRTIVKREDYSLDIIWQNELMYGKTSRNINWGTSNGKVDLSKVEAKSLVGLGFNF